MQEIEFRFPGHRFRVMTPKTMQWTPLKEDCGANARSVMKGTAFDGKNHSLDLRRVLLERFKHTVSGG